MEKVLEFLIKRGIHAEISHDNVKDALCIALYIGESEKSFKIFIKFSTIERIFRFVRHLKANMAGKKDE